MWYSFLNIFLFIFHTLFTLFNLTGWIFKKTRKLHLITISLTAFSWFFLGIWYGWGYCFCTDWHWDVRRKLGFHDDSDSYIQFLIQKLTGIEVPYILVERYTLIIFILCFILSILMNLRNRKRNKI